MVADSPVVSGDRDYLCENLAAMPSKVTRGRLGGVLFIAPHCKRRSTNGGIGYSGWKELSTASFRARQVRFFVSYVRRLM